MFNVVYVAKNMKIRVLDSTKPEYNQSVVIDCTTEAEKQNTFRQCTFSDMLKLSVFNFQFSVVTTVCFTVLLG